MLRKFSQLCCLVAFSAAAPVLFAGPVNINTADAETLALELSGVGPALAAKIVEYREQNGRFESADSLMQVSGIGARVIEMNRANILVSDA